MATTDAEGEAAWEGLPKTHQRPKEDAMTQNIGTIDRVLRAFVIAPVAVIASAIAYAAVTRS